MPTSHTCKQGDCLSSIAFAYGLFPDTIWYHPDNQELRKKRQDPHCLAAGDMVVVPDLRLKHLSCQIESKNRFRRKGVPAQFHLRLVEDGEPRVGVPFRVDIDGTLESGESDGEGRIRFSLPPDAKRGVLYLGPPDEETEYDLAFGTLHPADTVRGAQTRLPSLGFPCGEVTGEMNDETRAALLAFQQWFAHPEPNGELDDQTARMLGQLHDQP